jgi:hypothetical protein
VEENECQQRLCYPHVVPAWLGISFTALRRLAGPFERLDGPLLRDSQDGCGLRAVPVFLFFDVEQGERSEVEPG